jgi:hypothetical protein
LWAATKDISEETILKSLRICEARRAKSASAWQQGHIHFEDNGRSRSSAVDMLLELEMVDVAAG